MANFLDNLNSPQKRAVTHKDGPLLVIAGAGAGKTRVITYRIAELIRNGVAPDSILAVTFTNKAAGEMKERVHSLLSQSSFTNMPVREQVFPHMGTFHSLGAHILRTHGHRIGVPKRFVIKNKSDALTLLKEAIREEGRDPKEVEPKKIQGIISKQKGELVTPEMYQEKSQNVPFLLLVYSVWMRYEALLKKEHALDFDDLLVKTMQLLKKDEEVREYYQNKWKYVHIDEYQDTNYVQYRMAIILAEKHLNICVVGDSDQCLVAGTKVAMADGDLQPIEKIRRGSHVLSCYGSGDYRPAIVTRTHVRAYSGKLITISTKSGNIITSTPTHIHFAGFKPELTPQNYFTYLMYKQGVGFRLGVSQMYTRGQKRPMLGFMQRCNQEHADMLWILGVHSSPNKARVQEYIYSLEYKIPTLPFVARKTRAKSIQSGYVHDQKIINEIFSIFDTTCSGRKLLEGLGFSYDFPHHRAQALSNIRKNIHISLCGDRRGETPMHRITMEGNDSETKDILLSLGYSARIAKQGMGRERWRVGIHRKDYGDIMKISEDIRTHIPDTIILKTARLGKNRKYIRGKNSLPFLPAASIVPGMVMFLKNGGYDIVTHVEHKTMTRQKVYDLDIANTHNFIAENIVTHNSIYGWRGARMKNLLQFEKDYPNAETVFLEENYRSTKVILEAAQSVIEKNQIRFPKKLFTKNIEGEHISLSVAPTGGEEARHIAKSASEFIRRGVKAENMAVLYRTNFQSRSLEEAFLDAGVPYQVIGTRFFERKEVRDILAYIYAARNKDSLGAVKRIINVPPRGIGKVTIAKLFSGYKDTLPASMRIKVSLFYELLDRIAMAAEEKTPSELVKYVLRETKIDEHLKKEGEEGKERLLNIQELATHASRYSALPKEEALEKFLEDSALAADQDALERLGKGVRLMTIHAAKGLEFPYVFIAGLEEGLFPIVRESSASSLEDGEEERRLFYVALTRAGKKVFLSYAETRLIFGSLQICAPSSFLADVPEELLEIEYTTGEDPLKVIEF
jgi:DNA helicase II / ATP-dependent DNA helicase PcrA